jgi:drug/metabolite transporter (DMT)-like permease
MTSTAAALWLINLALDTAGQMVFKAAAVDSAAATGWSRWRAVARDRRIWLGVACYCVEFVTWLAFLTLVPLSVAVLLASVNVVTVMIGGRLIFHETGGSLRTAGVLMAAAGVAIVGLGST